MHPISKVFGTPKKGVHAIRVSDIAIVDVLLTFLFAFAIAKIQKLSFPLVLVGIFLVGIIAHRFLGVRTTVDKFLFTE